MEISDRSPLSRLPPDGHSSTASAARATPATATKSAREAGPSHLRSPRHHPAALPPAVRPLSRSLPLPSSARRVTGEAGRARRS
jgi:hypothetical protein